MKVFQWLVFAIVAVTVAGCGTPEDSPDRSDEPVKVGAVRLFDDYYHLIENKRVGLITNHSAMVGDRHLVDLLHEDPSVQLVALFGPEHGIRGTADAGEAVGHGVDEATGVPVYSLYGAQRRPSLEMLEGVEVLLFDIQDVGTRFYTYPATMGRAMSSAVEAGIPYVVLDRPNPIGGERIEGHIREDRFVSGIGLYPVPVTHGMTVGELALMIQDQGWHDDLDGLDLHVVPMSGWKRHMTWFDTGLTWVPPSPNIPNAETAIVYPGTCLFEGTPASEGRGTRQPFLLVGSPHVTAETVSDELNRRRQHLDRYPGLEGVRFHPVVFVPESIPGMSRYPKLEGEDVRGVRIEVTDPAVVSPVALGMHLLQVFYEALPMDQQRLFFHPRGMPVRAGNEWVQEQMALGTPVLDILADWEEDVSRFREMRRPYLLY